LLVAPVWASALFFFRVKPWIVVRLHFGCIQTAFGILPEQIGAFLQLFLCAVFGGTAVLL
jgi:hypothetical protein